MRVGSQSRAGRVGCTQPDLVLHVRPASRRRDPGIDSARPPAA